MPPLPPPFGVRPSSREKDPDSDTLCARALHDDPFADTRRRFLPSISPAVSPSTASYSPRRRLSQRMHGPFPPGPASSQGQGMPGVDLSLPPTRYSLTPPPPPVGYAPALSSNGEVAAAVSSHAESQLMGFAPVSSSLSQPGPGPEMDLVGEATNPGPPLAPPPEHLSGMQPLPTGTDVLQQPVTAISQPYSPQLAAQPPPASLSAAAHSQDDSNSDQTPPLCRRRQFKYLTDEPEPAPQGKDATVPYEVPESRKKVKRACIFCKRSHMPCDVSRPCKRCIKRKIAHLCKDEPATETPSTRTRGATNISTTQHAGTNQHTVTRQKGPIPPSIAPSNELDSEENRRQSRVMLPISLLLTENSGPSSRMASSSNDTSALDAATTAANVERERLVRAELLEAVEKVQKLMTHLDGYDRNLLSTILNEEEFDLAETGGDPFSGDMDEQQRQQILSESIALKEALRHSTSAIQEEALIAVLRARPQHGYSWGGNRLSQWLKVNTTPESHALIDSLLGEVRRRYLQATLGMTREQLLALGSATMMGVSHYRLNVFETVPHGMLVFSRTGRILASNLRMARWTQLPQHVLTSGHCFYFYLMHSPHIRKFLDTYSAIALNGSIRSRRSQADQREDAGSRSGGTSLTDSASLIHRFDVDRLLFLRNTAAWNMIKAEFFPGVPTQLEDGSPSVHSFDALVTLQICLHEGNPDVPLFLVAYVSEPPNT